MTDDQAYVCVEVNAALLETVRETVLSKNERDSERDSERIDRVLSEAGVDDMRGEGDVMNDSDVRLWLVDAALRHFLNHASDSLVIV